MRAGGAVGADEWQGRTGQSWAAEWRRTDRGFAMLTEHLLRKSRDFHFESVLDIGCGAGELSLAIARGRPQCEVVGLDISPPLVEAARERGANHRNVAFEHGDAATWRPERPFAPDLLVSRHGVMFFERPARAFAHLRAIAAPGANLLFSCFRSWEQNPVFADLAALLPDPPPPPDTGRPGPFAFANRARIEAVLGEAGWAGIAVEPFDFAMIVGGGAEPVEDAVSYFGRIGVAARAARELGDEARERFFARVRQYAERHLREGIVAMRAGAWVVTARR